MSTIASVSFGLDQTALQSFGGSGRVDSSSSPGFESNSVVSSFKEDEVDLSSGLQNKLVNKESEEKDSEKINRFAQEQVAKKQEEKEEELSEFEQKMATEVFNDLNRQNIGLSFSIEKDMGSTVVSVLDNNTEDIIRQIPSEEFLKLAKRIHDLKEQQTSSSDDSKDVLKGILLDDQA
ncbi:MAG: flagellar protein FlaG [Succinivibrio sp.]|nr:flagellar protein FlaG [Succinivibrio sp.]